MSQKTCFVLSPIGAPSSEIRQRADRVFDQIIQPAVARHGFAVIRADDMAMPGPITHQVVQMVMDADLVVADLTGRNPNVFYELALRHASGKPVVQLMEADESIPFDVAGIRTVLFDRRSLEGISAARAELSRQVAALESGSGAIPILDVTTIGALRQLRNARLTGVLSSFCGDAVPWDELFASTAEVTVMFAYAHSWRDKNDRYIRLFLENENAVLRVIVPNPDNPLVVGSLRSQHEQDGSDPGEKIRDSMRYYQSAGAAGRGTVEVRLMERLPSLAVYMFDREVIFTLNPNRPGRRPVPTFTADRGGELYSYFADELKSIIAEHSTAASVTPGAEEEELA